MFKLSELFVEISARTQPLDRALAGLRARLGRIASTPIPLGGGGLASILGVGAGAVGLYKTITAASDLNETLNNVRVSFGEFSKTAIDAADGMAKRFGIGRRTFLEGAVAIGSMGKALGLTTRSASDFGTEVTKLAADFSSLKNISIEDSVRVFQSALSGEIEPLRRYGIIINETLTKQEAYRLGIAKVGQELTEQQKLQARYSLLIKGTADAQGDLDRTSKEYANQVRSLQGNLQNLAETVGSALLPAASALVSNLADLVSAASQAASGTDKLNTSASVFVDKINDAALITRNFGDIIERTGTMIGGYFGESMAYIVAVAKEGFGVWVQIAKNAASNVMSIFSEVYQYITTLGKDPIEIHMKPILEGVNVKLPTLDFGAVEAKLQEIDNRMAEREKTRLEEAQKRQEKIAAGQAKLEFGPNDAFGAKADKVGFADASEYSRQIQRAALEAKDKVPEQQLAQMKESKEVLTQIRDAIKGAPKGSVAVYG